VDPCLHWVVLLGRRMCLICRGRDGDGMIVVIASEGQLGSRAGTLEYCFALPRRTSRSCTQIEDSVSVSTWRKNPPVWPRPVTVTVTVDRGLPTLAKVSYSGSVVYTVRLHRYRRLPLSPCPPSTPSSSSARIW